MIKKEMIAMLLAGGQGSRLGVLTAKVEMCIRDSASTARTGIKYGYANYKPILTIRRIVG